ncbi:unnamed protein product [Arabidopsis lyrata]|nr:unnamed protein product [Arabidopsis lyrata]
MAMRKLLSKKLFNITNVASQSLMNCRISSSSLAVRTRVPTDSTDTTKISPEPGDSTISRRFMHNSAMIRPEIMQMPVGESLIEKLREIDGSKDRIRLDGLTPPERESSLTVADTKKLLRAAQIEIVKSKLRETGRSWMSYSEFVSVCGEASSDPDLGSRIAKMLDDSANVIVLGDSVCIRPDQLLPKTDTIFIRLYLFFFWLQFNRRIKNLCVFIPEFHRRFPSLREVVIKRNSFYRDHYFLNQKKKKPLVGIRVKLSQEREKLRLCYTNKFLRVIRINQSGKID